MLDTLPEAAMRIFSSMLLFSLLCGATAAHAQATPKHQGYWISWWLISL